MNFPLFIAKRIAGSKKDSFSKIIIRLATIATALSVAIMIIAIAIVQGFKKNIEDKLFVFWDDINIAQFSPNGILAQSSIEKDAKLESTLLAHNNVAAIQPYALKPAIIKGSESITGIKLKGVTQSYQLHSDHLIKFTGDKIDFSEEGYGKTILLSPNILNRLNIKIGEDVLAYFVEEGQTSPRVRKLKVVGSFHTGVGEIDNTFALCDIRLIQHLNKWSSNTISGYQLKVKDRAYVKILSDDIYNNYLREPLVSETVADIYPGIISWITVQNINAQILLIIMSIVAIINIMTALLIFILERTYMIGTLKSLGMDNLSIQKIFLYHATIISTKGVLYGIILGLLACYLQWHFQFITLDEEIYYMEYAPISWEWFWFGIVAIATILLTFLLMIIPSMLARKVNIVKAIRFK